VTLTHHSRPPYQYLHTCLELHPDLTERHFGRRVNLRAIEATTKNIRSSRKFRYSDIARIRNSDLWNADQFGYWPSRQDIGALLENADWDWWNLPKNESRAISRLLAVFQQIEPVTVILRFIAPEHYGILSPPVEQLLGIAPSRSRRKKYQAYLQNLRRIRDAKRFASAADADMALWVLQVGVLEQRLPDHHRLRRSYDRDLMLKEIRVSNLTTDLFQSMSRSALAESLLPTNPLLACQLAAMEFERCVRLLTPGPRRQPPSKQLPSLYELVRLVCSADDLQPFQPEWIKAVQARNRAVHRDQPLRPDAARILLQAMNDAVRLAAERCGAQCPPHE